MKLYIAGPMRGLPDFNFAAFDDAAAKYRANGFQVINPADHDRETYPDIETWKGFATGDPKGCPKFDLREALQWDLSMICRYCDGVVLLPGWSKSTGARVEHALAVALDLTLFYEATAESLVA